MQKPAAQAPKPAAPRRADTVAEARRAAPAPQAPWLHRRPSRSTAAPAAGPRRQARRLSRRSRRQRRKRRSQRPLRSRSPQAGRGTRPAAPRRARHARGSGRGAEKESRPSRTRAGRAAGQGSAAGPAAGPAPIGPVDREQDPLQRPGDRGALPGRGAVNELLALRQVARQGRQHRHDAADDRRLARRDRDRRGAAQGRRRPAAPGPGGETAISIARERKDAAMLGLLQGTKR